MSLSKSRNTRKQDATVSIQQISDSDHEVATELRRRPSQERSRKRYDAILNAAKTLIAQKGSAQLKIQDIANLAGVTPASIYQYFPSKNAITLALAQHTFDHAFQSLNDSLPKAETLDQACLMLQALIETHYQIYLNDPAMIDIWVSISADKTLQDLDLEDSRRQAKVIFESIKHFFEPDLWSKLYQVSFLLSHMVGSAIRMALQVPAEEGRGLMDSFKSLLNPASLQSMLNNPSITATF
jgi:AcrR family transcriptional regulator